jgi:hypothetical protein
MKRKKGRTKTEIEKVKSEKGTWGFHIFLAPKPKHGRSTSRTINFL